jgi:hypothetical protein
VLPQDPVQIRRDRGGADTQAFRPADPTAIRDPFHSTQADEPTAAHSGAQAPDTEPAAAPPRALDHRLPRDRLRPRTARFQHLWCPFPMSASPWPGDGRQACSLASRLPFHDSQDWAPLQFTIPRRIRASSPGAGWQATAKSFFTSAGTLAGGVCAWLAVPLAMPTPFMCPLVRWLPVYPVTWA